MQGNTLQKEKDMTLNKILAEIRVEQRDNSANERYNKHQKWKADK